MNCEPGGGTNTCKVSSRNGLAQTYLDINAPIIRQIFRTGESIAFASATIYGIAIDTYNFDKSTVENISSVIKRDATLKEALIAEMELFSRTNDNIRLKATCTIINYEYSEDENGKGECSASSESSATFFPSSSVFAEDDSYVTYLPEYGLYDFQLGDYVLNKDVLDSGDCCLLCRD